LKNTITNITETPDYTPETIKQIIGQLKINEKSLALLLNVSPMTIKLWMAGAVKPCGLSRRLMQIYELCPEVIDRLAEGSEKNEPIPRENY
jgi:putative transcriptional regulator